MICGHSLSDDDAPPASTCLALEDNGDHSLIAAMATKPRYNSLALSYGFATRRQGLSFVDEALHLVRHAKLVDRPTFVVDFLA